MSHPEYPLLSVDPNKVVFVAVGLALKEAVAKGVLTAAQLEDINVRGEELVSAFATGKIIEIDAAGMITIRDRDEDETREMESRPGEFGLTKAAKKTLDV